MSDRRRDYGSSPYDSQDSYSSRQGSSRQSGYNDNSGYASGDSYYAGGQGASGQQGRSYAQRGSDPYASGASQSRSAYDQQGYSQRSPYGGSQQGAGRYGQQDAYSSTSRSAYGSQQGRSGSRQSAAQYPVGQGQAYTSSRRAGNASGVTPVSATAHRDYSPGSNLTPQGGEGISRRSMLKVGIGAGIAAAVLGVAGAVWYTHRAVACTIDGKVNELPVGLSASDIVSRGCASPSNGNLVSICEDGEVPTVLEKGAGNPYTLCVNGEPTDTDTYRLADGDVLEFINGTDVTEDVTTVTTETEPGIQIPDNAMLLASLGYVQQWGRTGISTVETGTVSGRTIDRGVTQEAQDLIITHSGVNPDDGRRLVALTFDDGPDLTYTPQYLDILSSYGAKATFFMIGTSLEMGGEYAEMACRVRDEGHQIASHTYSHSDATLSGMDAEQRNEDISKCFDLIKQVTGVETTVFRPPYGEFRGYQFLQYMAMTGRDITSSVYWSVDSEDWSVAVSGVDTSTGAATIVSNCTKSLSGDNYNGAIILMHDGGGNRSMDVVALPTILETFQAQGYEFVTINELVAADSTYPEWVSSGNAVRPSDSVIPDTTGYY
jgi:peptidoglycan-N-acetylglucosamine deacetylase